MTIAENLKGIRDRIVAAAERSGRDPKAVRLVAVSKKMAAERIHEAYLAGQRDFGENYLQEAMAKMDRLPPDINWHFIGRLQSNKAQAAAERFAMVETVDRMKLAKALHRYAARAGRRLPVLIQVNVGREPQKGGVLPEDLPSFAREISAFSSLDLRGLMTMPPYLPDPEAVRPFFRELSRLAEELRRQGLLGRDGGAVELSMGMSHDFEVAVEEGATLVRVGTALFGPRDEQPALKRGC